MKTSCAKIREQKLSIAEKLLIKAQNNNFSHVF